MEFLDNLCKYATPIIENAGGSNIVLRTNKDHKIRIEFLRESIHYVFIVSRRILGLYRIHEWGFCYWTPEFIKLNAQLRTIEEYCELHAKKIIDIEFSKLRISNSYDNNAGRVFVEYIPQLIRANYQPYCIASQCHIGMHFIMRF